jgi:hypothetical protein
VPKHPPPAEAVVEGATWTFQVASEPVGKASHIIRPGGAPCRLCGQSKAFPSIGLKDKSRAFELEIGRLAKGCLPVLGASMIAIDVESYKKRPKHLITRTRPRGPIPCPVKPDGSNILKSCEDALMRCRHCGKAGSKCKQRHHTYTPTLNDDATIVDTRCRTFYTSVLDLKAKISRPGRIVITISVVVAPVAALVQPSSEKVKLL